MRWLGRRTKFHCGDHKGGRAHFEAIAFPRKFLREKCKTDGSREMWIDTLDKQQNEAKKKSS